MIQEAECREKAQSKRKVDEQLVLVKKELDRLKGRIAPTNLGEDKAALQKLDICMVRLPSFH